MSTEPRYCPHCGAANAEENQLCFSCQSPLGHADPATSDVLLNGRYQLLTQVGSGGFGGVYRAVDTFEAGHIVAVKQINLRGLSTQEAIEATDGFNREVRLLSTLHHPNLPVIQNTFTDTENWYLVMDFIAGETLETYLKENGRPGLPLREVLEISLQLCTVLEYLHTRQPVIIFRDLKPGNVMRTFAGQIYLIDFGIARHFTPGQPRDTMPFGSPGYAAPEQYGKAQTTPQADIYSLGALIHHLLTGNDPAESPFRFSPLPMADSTKLGELDALIQRMVTTEPGERPGSIAEVKTVLQSLANTIAERARRVSFADAPSTPIWPAPAQVPARSGLTRRRVFINTLKISGIVVGVGSVVGMCTIVGTYLSVPRVHGIVAEPPPSPESARQQLIYRGHKGPITALSWSPDGTMVASGSTDNTVQVWRAADGALLYTLSGYTDAVTSISWATDRTNVIASAGNNDGTVQVWDALRDHRDLIYHGDGRVLALSWKLDSPWIVSGGTDEDIYIWNSVTGGKGASYGGHKGNVNAVTWLANSLNPYATPGIAATSLSPTPPPTFAPTPTPPPTPTPGSTLPSTPTPPPTPAPLPTYQQLIASGGADSTVQLWEASTGKQIFTYRGHQGGINGLSSALSSPDGSASPLIASASDDGSVQTWKIVYLETGMVNYQTYVIYHGHQGKVNAVATLSAAAYYGIRMASAGDDRTVQVWSANSGETLIRYAGHRAPVKALATSPVDSRIVSGDTDGLVHLWTVTAPSY